MRGGNNWTVAAGISLAAIKLDTINVNTKALRLTGDALAVRSPATCGGVHEPRPGIYLRP